MNLSGAVRFKVEEKGGDNGNILQGCRGGASPGIC